MVENAHDAETGVFTLVPLIVGVTGHRDLRDEDVLRLEAEVAEVFTDLRAQYLETPLILLTSLAEGSDRLVVRVALQFQAEDRSRIRIIAPLPMPRTLYERDFRSPDDPGCASLREFEDLLERVDDWFELPILPGYTERDIQAGVGPRDRQYEQAGAFVAAHSQVLLALWDGVPTQKIGGTGRVVDFVLKGLPPEYAPQRGPIDQLELGPVYHIVTPHRDNANVIGQALTLRQLWPAQFGEGEPTREAARKTQELYDRTFRRIDTFNRDVGRYRRSLDGGLKRSRQGLLEENERSDLTDDVQFLLNCYAEADALAALFRRKTDATRFLVFLLTFFTALSFGVYAHLGHWPPILLLYGILLAATVSVYAWAAPIDDPPGLLKVVLGAPAARAGWARRGDFQNKAQDYRALAEGLRVQLFWRLAGVPDSVADHYLLKQKSELDWIRVALRNWTLVADHQVRAAAGGNVTRDPERLQRVLEHWIKHEQAYYREAAARDRAELLHHTKRARWALATGTLSTVALAVSLNFPVPWRRWLTTWFVVGHELRYGLVIAVILALLVLAALLFAYADEKVLEDHVKQYQRMMAIFNDAGKRLAQTLAAGDFAGAQRLILHLGQEALVENGDWVIVHRSRPLEIRTG